MVKCDKCKSINCDCLDVFAEVNEGDICYFVCLDCGYQFTGLDEKDKGAE